MERQRESESLVTLLLFQYKAREYQETLKWLTANKRKFKTEATYKFNLMLCSHFPTPSGII